MSWGIIFSGCMSVRPILVNVIFQEQLEEISWHIWENTFLAIIQQFI